MLVPFWGPVFLPLCITFSLSLFVLCLVSSGLLLGESTCSIYGSNSSTFITLKIICYSVSSSLFLPGGIWFFFLIRFEFQSSLFLCYFSDCSLAKFLSPTVQCSCLYLEFAVFFFIFLLIIFSSTLTGFGLFLLLLSFFFRCTF